MISGLDYLIFANNFLKILNLLPPSLLLVTAILMVYKKFISRKLAGSGTEKLPIFGL
jgi:hypothetical protein